MKPMDIINLIALVLLVIGGINWGLVGLFNFDVVSLAFGDATMASKVVYALVGICALYEAIRWTINRQWMKHA